MKDSDFLDLANRVIDGVGSEHDAAALEAVVHSSTQRRLEFDQLSAVASILDAVRPVEPPAGLRNRILSSLPLKVEAEPSRLTSVWASLVDSIRARPQVSLAYAVIGGLVVGIVGLSALTGALRTEDSNVFGTMSAYSSSEGLIRTDEARVTGDGVDADLALVVADEAFRVELELLTERPVDVEMTVRPQSGRWAGILRAEGSSELSARVGSGTTSLSRLESGTYAFVGSADDPLADGSFVDVVFRVGQDVVGTAKLEFGAHPRNTFQP